MIDRLNKDLSAAMKSGDKARLAVLRMMKSKILNVNARGDLPERELIKILQNYAKTLKESMEMMVQHGRQQEADGVKAELAIVEEYLPMMLSEEETKKLVQDTIAAIGATSIREIGKIMKEITGKRSDVDGSQVRKIVSEILK